jgi:hypothetical protein
MSGNANGDASEPEDVNGMAQRLCVWCGPALMGVFFAAIAIAHWLPAPSPSQTVQQTVDAYVRHANGIRVASLLIALAGALYGPFVAALNVHVKRMQGRYAPLAHAQMGLGMLVVAFFMVPSFFFMTAAFRPDRVGGEITQVMHDAGWLILFGAIWPGIFQNLALGIAIMTNRANAVIYPRWVGYFTIWIATLYLPSALLLFFKRGIFAWNGLLVFWLAAVAFSTWLIVMMVMTLKAIREQESIAGAREAVTPIGVMTAARPAAAGTR